MNSDYDTLFQNNGSGYSRFHYWSVRIVAAAILIVISSSITLLVVFYESTNKKRSKSSSSVYLEELADANKNTFNQYTFVDAEALCLSAVKRSYELKDRIHVTVDSRSTRSLKGGTIKVFLEIPTTSRVEGRSFSCIANTKDNIVKVNSVTNPNSGAVGLEWITKNT